MPTENSSDLLTDIKNLLSQFLMRGGASYAQTGPMAGPQHNSAYNSYASDVNRMRMQAAMAFNASDPLAARMTAIAFAGAAGERRKAELREKFGDSADQIISQIAGSDAFATLHGQGRREDLFTGVHQAMMRGMSVNGRMTGANNAVGFALAKDTATALSKQFAGADGMINKSFTGGADFTQMGSRIASMGQGGAFDDLNNVTTSVGKDGKMKVEAIEKDRKELFRRINSGLETFAELRSVFGDKTDAQLDEISKRMAGMTVGQDARGARSRVSEIVKRNRTIAIRAGVDERAYNEFAMQNSAIAGQSFGAVAGSEVGQRIAEAAIDQVSYSQRDAATLGAKGLGTVFGEASRPGTYQARTMSEAGAMAQSFQNNLQQFGSSGKDQQIAGYLLKSGTITSEAAKKALTDVYENGTVASGQARSLINLHSNESSFNELQRGVSVEDQADVGKKVFEKNNERIKDMAYRGTRIAISDMESNGGLTSEDAAAMNKTQDAFEKVRGKFRMSDLESLAQMDDNEMNDWLKKSGVNMTDDDRKNLDEFRGARADMSVSQGNSWAQINRRNEESYGISEKDHRDAELQRAFIGERVNSSDYSGGMVENLIKGLVGEGGFSKSKSEEMMSGLGMAAQSGSPEDQAKAKEAMKKFGLKEGEDIHTADEKTLNAKLKAITGNDYNFKSFDDFVTNQDAMSAVKDKGFSLHRNEEGTQGAFTKDATRDRLAKTGETEAKIARLEHSGYGGAIKGSLGGDDADKLRAYVRKNQGFGDDAEGRRMKKQYEDATKAADGADPFNAKVKALKEANLGDKSTLASYEKDLSMEGAGMREKIIATTKDRLTAERSRLTDGKNDPENLNAKDKETYNKLTAQLENLGKLFAAKEEGKGKYLGTLEVVTTGGARLKLEQKS